MRILSVGLAVLALLVLCSGMSAFAGTIYFTGSGDANLLSVDPDGWDYGSGITYSANGIHFGNAGSTDIVAAFTEVNATTLANMGTLTCILAEPYAASAGYGIWTYLDRAAGDLIVGIGDSSEEGGGTNGVYLWLAGTAAVSLTGSENATGYQLSSDGANLTLSPTWDYGATWPESQTWALDRLPLSGVDGSYALAEIGFGAWHEPYGSGHEDVQVVCEIAWECDDFSNLNAPGAPCGTGAEGEGESEGEGEGEGEGEPARPCQEPITYTWTGTGDATPLQAAGYGGSVTATGSGYELSLAEAGFEGVVGLPDGVAPQDYVYTVVCSTDLATVADGGYVGFVLGSWENLQAIWYGIYEGEYYVGATDDAWTEAVPTGTGGFALRVSRTGDILTYEYTNPGSPTSFIVLGTQDLAAAGKENDYTDFSAGGDLFGVEIMTGAGMDGGGTVVLESVTLELAGNLGSDCVYFPPTQGTPVAGMMGLGLVAAACALGGALTLRKK